jgi:demethylmenaquinone methyltransferase/2-methoxy-6-polyprenyl-1,4-benzoquinol methylase
MFGEIAPRYDLLNHLLSGGVDVYWRWRTVRAAPPDGEAPILDVCTGTGDLALAYARAAATAPVIGTDFTHEMLVLADAKLPAAGLAARICFLEADAQHLPFADGQFQIVSVAFGLRNIADTRAGLHEMTRVCRPGGRVVVLEFSTPRIRLFGAAYRWYFRHVLPRIGQLLARNRESAYSYLPQSVSEFPDGPKLAAIMQECGLTDVSHRPLTGGIATLYVGRKSDGEPGRRD